MAFCDELKKWRGGRLQKQVNELFGVSLKTYQAWEQSVNTPHELGLKQCRWIMGADAAGVPVHIYIQNYYRIIKQVAAEINAR